MDEDVGKTVAIIVVLVIVLGVLALYFDFFGFLYSKIMGPRKENLKREIYEETKSYNEGKEQDLLKYRLEYLKADDEEKKALASTIRMMFADYDDTKLNLVLSKFLNEIRYGVIEEWKDF